MTSVFKILTTVAALAIGFAVSAQTPAVTSVLVAQRVEMVNGQAVLKSATQAGPGDVVSYTSTYRNNSGNAVEKMLAVVPVPFGTTLLGESPMPPNAQATTDGKTYSAMPLMRAVKQPDGSMRNMPVPLAEYRALRWDIGSLGSGKSVAVSLQVRLDAPLASPTTPVASLSTPQPAVKP